jgi:hypothetical protein
MIVTQIDQNREVVEVDMYVSGIGVSVRFSGSGYPIYSISSF